MSFLWYRLPLPLKFALAAAALTLTAALAMFGTAQLAQRQRLDAQIESLAQALTTRLAANAARPLIDNDPVRLQAVVGEFAAAAPVQRAAVFDLQQNLVGAAGDDRAGGQEYAAPVHWQDSAVGRVTLTLKPDAGADNKLTDLRPRDLLTLAGLLALGAAFIGAWLGRRFEAQLLVLMRRLSGETVAVSYPDTDTLGHLLHHPVPPLLVAEPAPAPHRGATLLHVYCPSEATVDCERALRDAGAVAALYRGEVAITRAGGITVRFPADDDEMEAPFRALCAAQLLRCLSAPHALRLALKPLAASEDGEPWREQQLLRELNQVCVDREQDNEIALDAQLQRHPAIQERCALQARADVWIVTALRAPYDTLLERQFATLRTQLEATPENGAAPD